MFFDKMVTPTHPYTVPKICLSACLTNFDLGYLGTGELEWAETFLGYLQTEFGKNNSQIFKWA